MPLAEERVRVRGGVGGQDGDPLGVGVAVALLPAALAGPGLPRGRGEPGPGHQRLRGREAAHVQADLGDQRRRRPPCPGRGSHPAGPRRAARRRPARPASGPVTPSASTPQDGGDRGQVRGDLLLQVR